MTPLHSVAPSDWDDIRLVVFDVDGTLYRQGPLRLKMSRDIFIYAILNRDFNVVSVLAKYRNIRERLAHEQVVDFDHVLIDETAKVTGNSPDTVRAIVSEWIERRPLSYVPSCVYPGVSDLFAGLRGKGKSIGILSDYPAKEKLAVLGLTADHVVAAGDVGRLKPHPRGLESLMVAAGVTARETVMVGDRVDRDGLAAQRVGARALIRSSKPIAGWQTFTSFEDALFAPFVEC